MYADREDTLAWASAFEADSDGPVTIQGINTIYRFRGGVAEIAFVRDDIIVVSSSVAAPGPAGSRPAGSGCTGGRGDRAEALIKNFS